MTYSYLKTQQYRFLLGWHLHRQEKLYQTHFNTYTKIHLTINVNLSRGNFLKLQNFEILSPRLFVLLTTIYFEMKSYLKSFWFTTNVWVNNKRAQFIAKLRSFQSGFCSNKMFFFSMKISLHILIVNGHS